jgi:exopolyphosphatase/pppGpp-phosphohydrolase
MDKIAIIDIGSARIKATIATIEDGYSSFINLKDETYLSSHVDENNIIDEEFVRNVLVKKLEEYVSIAREKGCVRLLTVGTHIFRTAKNSDIISKIIKDITGELNIIEDWIEGGIFYSWMKTSLNHENMCVIDIGGGSVQVSFGEEKENIFSMPTGTFTLEKKFQTRKEYCSNDELDAMANYIKSNLSTINVSKKPVEFAVMGSNCMKDFIEALTVNILEEDPKVILSNNIYVNQKEMFKKLLSSIKEKNYSDLFDLYPQNKFFMYGADKALVNLLEICEYLSIDLIYPTNESLSTSLINILSTNPKKLENFKIRYFDLI